MFKLHIYLDIIKNNKSRSLFLKRNTSLKGIGMNKIYKIVWNASLGAWVAVSEIAKGKTKVNIAKFLIIYHNRSYGILNRF